MHVLVRGDGWQRVAVDPHVSFVESNDAGVVVCPDGQTLLPPLAAVVSFADNGVARAALITHAASDVILNGYPPLGVAVLQDRDEIVVRGATFYFTTRSPAEAVPFPGTGADTRCGRCKRPLRAGDMAVRCPACGAWHHEGPLAAAPQQRGCWSYDPNCGGCGHGRASVVWVPEEEDDDAPWR